MTGDFEKLKEIKTKAEEWLFRIPGVTGVAVGLKQVNKKQVPGNFAIAVFVEKKKKKEDLSSAELIPAEIDGIKTDIIQSGKLYIRENINVGGQEVESDANKAGGTLGCFATVISGPNTGKTVLLTNQHVVFNGKDKGPPYADKVGDICSSCSPCCSTYIGKTLDAELNEQMDAAIAELDAGVKYQPQVQDLWPIVGVHQFQPNDLVHSLEVKKYGHSTKETKGILQHTLFSGNIQEHGGGIHGHFTSQFIIGAVVSGPGRPVFSQYGDSGSIVLLNDNTVLGLLMGGTGDGYSDDVGIVCPIQAIIDRFHLRIETSNHLGDTRTVPAAIPVPGGGAQPLTGGGGISPHLRFTILTDEQQRILASPKGRKYTDFFGKHREEIRHLINKNRVVAMAWHRNRGPAILNLMVQYVEKKNWPFPKTINGRSFMDCLYNVGKVLRQFGSKKMAKDFEATEEVLMETTEMGYEEFFQKYIAA